ncbi:EF-hand domain-containing protein [Roseibium aggregatum]|uniref:EF-hand domain-containing protein n=1 Tax=Roseibium aggregatum TaxID=187304 RepID=A0A926S6Q3_9HYPH|nr:EF-hand domain-containing protein [Roseibium aggregatum]MBD1548783.1 EF-hand domain-containing protein [Roseibium aggregatum]
MKKFLLSSACVIGIASMAGAAQAQQGSPMMGKSGSGMMTDQDNDQTRPMPGYGYDRRGTMPWGYGHMGPGMMYGRGGGYGMGPGMMGGRGWGYGGMGPGMMGPRMMILMMDTNGDGKLSLDEFQAIQGRMFKYLDKNGDGQLTPDEIHNHWQDDDGDESGDAQ